MTAPVIDLLQRRALSAMLPREFEWWRARLFAAAATFGDEEMMAAELRTAKRASGPDPWRTLEAFEAAARERLAWTAEIVAMARTDAAFREVLEGLAEVERIEPGAGRRDAAARARPEAGGAGLTPSRDTARPEIAPPGRSCEAVQRAWLGLLPYMEAEDLRELLGEGGAFERHHRGVRDVSEPAVWPVVADVLAVIYGADPMGLVR